MFQTAVKWAFVVGGLAFAFPYAQASEAKRVVKVMTRNMDAGTDLNLVLADPSHLPDGVAATLAEVIASDMPGRASRLANEIRTNQPDFVALQEVTSWGTGPCGSPTTPVYDQLALLLDALKARNMRYKTLAVNNLTTVVAPADHGFATCVSYADRDALLVRSDLRPGDTAIDVDNVQVGQYTAKLDLTSIGFLPILRGYIMADVSTAAGTFRLVNTHLESTYPSLPIAAETQVAQADELLEMLSTTALPVLLCGDFNSNAEKTGPEQTATVEHVLDAGFSDVWQLFNAVGTGFTWPLFAEDGVAYPGAANERIDLIFVRGLRALKAIDTGTTAPFASDHAGVAAMVQVGKTE